MWHWFKPWTHWHEIASEAFDCLRAAGFGRDRLTMTGSPLPPGD